MLLVKLDGVVRYLCLTEATSLKQVSSLNRIFLFMFFVIHIGAGEGVGGFPVIFFLSMGNPQVLS